MRAIWILVLLAWVLILDFIQDHDRAPRASPRQPRNLKRDSPSKKPKGRRRPRDAL
jgi:hypothetical protein